MQDTKEKGERSWGTGHRALALWGAAWPSSLKSIPASAPPHLSWIPTASPLPLASASLPVLELIKTLSRLRFESLKAGSCPRHCSGRNGAQLLPSTPFLPPPREGAGTQMHPTPPPPLPSPSRHKSGPEPQTLTLSTAPRTNKGWLGLIISMSYPQITTK